MLVIDDIVVNIVIIWITNHNYMFVFFFVGFQWISILVYFVILCFEIVYNILRDLFLKLALDMFCIVIFCRIMNPSMDCGGDKVMYMLCIFKCTLSGGCRRSMIKLSNFVLVLWSLWDKKLGQLTIDIYWLWMFWRCLILICDGDIGNSLIWVLLVWHF
jgi:hypothetical protein